MTLDPHDILCNALDADETLPDDDIGTGTDELAQRLQEEHEARLRAEASSADQVQRLSVHSEQVSEYATQKERDLRELQRQAEALQAQLEGAPTALAEGVRRLFAYLADATEDAASFAAQAAEDNSRYKRAAAGGHDAVAAAASGAAAGERESPGAPASEAGGRGEANGAYGSPGSLGAQSTADVVGAEGDMDIDPLADDTGDSDSAPDAAAVGTDGPAAAAHPAPPLVPTHGPPSSTDVSRFTERARFVPMRLSLEDRRLFRLLEAALTVSDYTDRVDILMWKRKDGQILQQVKDVCSILSGLVVAQDYRRGQQLIKDRDFKRNAGFFQRVFEIGRRYKIMNPDRMRGTYGKLIYMLMDTAQPHIQDLLEFSCIRPLTTVYSFLKERGATELLNDSRMATATAEVVAAGRPRPEVAAAIARKEAARKALARAYQSSACSADDVLTAIYSFSDNNTYLLFNRDPIERMLHYLRTLFSPRDIEDNFSLSISTGRGGARLSHNHERQYTYVLQSLSLWSEISTDMFRLWVLAEQDLLSEGNRYRLCDTGQGLNRVQAAPRVSRAMAGILCRVQTGLGAWIGSSIVHLGDTNVPNALMFIDKYTQVPRILNPVVRVLDDIPRMAEADGELRAYIAARFGSVDRCVKHICCDFFRHAFDGSGADNFFDAGSCIDGRLTSAWNWCSKLERKPYYTVFKMTGFTGFDGDFR